jgi:hypothetical protein
VCPPLPIAWRRWSSSKSLSESYRAQMPGARHYRLVSQRPRLPDVHMDTAVTPFLRSHCRAFFSSTGWLRSRQFHANPGVSHGRYVTFQMAEVAVPRQRFAKILSLIAQLRAPPNRPRRPRCAEMSAKRRVPAPRDRAARHFWLPRDRLRIEFRCDGAPTRQRSSPTAGEPAECRLSPPAVLTTLTKDS